LSRGSLIEKGFGIRSASKLALGFQALFQFAEANPDGFAVRTAAWWTCALLNAVLLRQNGAPPRTLPSNKNGRPITHSVIARVKRAEKEPERRYASLLAISEFPTLFHTACRNKPTKDCLSE